MPVHGSDFTPEIRIPRGLLEEPAFHTGDLWGEHKASLQTKSLLPHHLLELSKSGVCRGGTVRFQGLLEPLALETDGGPNFKHL